MFSDKSIDYSRFTAAQTKMQCIILVLYLVIGNTQMASVNKCVVDNISFLFSVLENRIGQLDRDLIDLLSEMLTVVVNNTWPRVRLTYRGQISFPKIYKPKINIIISGSLGEKWCPYALTTNDMDALYACPGLHSPVK